FKAFSQFSRKGFKFLFVHNLPVSVAGVNISKTGNYTILITVSTILNPSHLLPRDGRLSVCLRFGYYKTMRKYPNQLSDIGSQYIPV
ncbi:hypothetical protein J1784_05300, partial [Rahnella sp. FRB 231]|nr:hypothetical protein [Rahnella ecdela]